MKFPLPLGTLINVGTVVLGSAIGLLLHKGFSDRIKEIIFQAVGLFSIGLGVMMIMDIQDPITVVFSLVIGGIIGEALKIEDRLNNAASKLQKKLKSDDKNFTEGLTSAFLIFCIGSMTFVGAIEEGLTGNHSLLITKSILDGFVSITLAASLGFGVLLSIIPLFIFQFGITLLAVVFQGLFSEVMIAQLSGLGGILILGVGINLLALKKIKLSNLLPSLIIIILLTVGNDWITGLLNR